MNALIAIVHDTWRQSRQQAVFIVMLVLLALLGVFAVVAPHPYEGDDGETRIGYLWGDGPSQELEDTWTVVYAQSVMLETGEPMDPFGIDDEQAKKFQDAFKEADAQVDVPYDRRAVEVLLNGVAAGIFTVSMLLFLAACSGYFPNMLESGAIDIVLAKPVDRLRIYLSKFAGGLALYTAAIAAVYFLIFVGVGLHTGVWVGRLFFVMPLQVFCAAVLFSIIAALGVVSRSSTLCVIVGLVFYLVIDTLIGILIGAQQTGFLSGLDGLDKAANILRYTFPNFGVLKANATSSVLNIPLLQWEPFVVALAWLLAALGFGYWRFNATDY